MVGQAKDTHQAPIHWWKFKVRVDIQSKIWPTALQLNSKL